MLTYTCHTQASRQCIHEQGHVPSAHDLLYLSIPVSLTVLQGASCLFMEGSRLFARYVTAVTLRSCLAKLQKRCDC